MHHLHKPLSIRIKWHFNIKIHVQLPTTEFKKIIDLENHAEFVKNESIFDETAQQLIIMMFINFGMDLKRE